MKINWWKVLAFLCFVYLFLVFFNHQQEARERAQYIENKGRDYLNTEYNLINNYMQYELKKNEELLNRGKEVVK